MPTTNIKHNHIGVCPCCGTNTACTQGLVVNGKDCVAKYLVKWTVGDPSHGMAWLISCRAADNWDPAVSLKYFFEQNSFMVSHLVDVSWSAEDLAGFGELIDREDVIGTPLANRIFSIVDDIWLTDPYIREFVDGVAAQDDEYEYLGTHSLVESRRLIDELERNGINFILLEDEAKSPEPSSHFAALSGSFGVGKEVSIGVSSEDYERAQEIRCRVLKIEP